MPVRLILIALVSLRDKRVRSEGRVSVLARKQWRVWLGQHCLRASSGTPIRNLDEALGVCPDSVRCHVRRLSEAVESLLIR